MHEGTWVIGVKDPRSVTSALNEGVCSASYHCHFTPIKDPRRNVEPYGQSEHYAEDRNPLPLLTIAPLFTCHPHHSPATTVRYPSFSDSHIPFPKCFQMGFEQ